VKASIVALAAAVAVTTYLAFSARGFSATGAPAATDRNELRVVTLAPNLAELMFAVDAGDQLVGVSAYTDFPPAAAELPIIGDAFAIDQEQLLILKPDILLAWDEGTPAHLLDRLRDEGYRVEVIATNGLDDVADALETIGALTGNPQQAKQAAEHYRQRIAALRERYKDTEPVRVFYQISSRPLFTVNGTHYISELLDLCGGQNIFSELGELAPMVDVEAVLSRDPEAMLAATDATEEAFDDWNSWPGMAANRYGNRFFMPAAEIGRATPRLVAAGQAVCEALEKARVNRRDYSRMQGTAE
jgi:iron complex transport system substrate-binding protein